jgi:multisubunit Na+/H+ antiporter MnhB subunit
VLASILRTVVPVVVGTLLGLAAKVGLDLPGGAVAALVTVVLTAAYYWLARLVEQTWPAVGRYLLALGLTGKQPLYFPPTAPNAPTRRDRP